MHMRRFARLTNAFSRTGENNAHAVALHMINFNFVRIHKTPRVIPAIAAGVADRLWEIGEIVSLIEAEEAKQSRQRGPHKKRTAQWPGQIQSGVDGIVTFALYLHHEIFDASLVGDNL